MEQWLVVLIFDNWSEHTKVGWNEYVWHLKLSMESTGKSKGMIVRGS